MRHIGNEQVFHSCSFFDHGWYHQQDQPCEHECNDKECHKDAHDAESQVAAILEELDQGEQQVGDEPRKEKRQQDTAEPVEQHDDAYHNDDSHNAADEAVKGDFFRFHGAKIQKLVKSEE